MASTRTSSVLLVWDRLGDYHRARASALAQEWKAGTVYTADLGAADPLYQWQNTQAETHFFLSTKPVDEPDTWGRVRRFIRLVRQHHIRVVGIAGYGRREYILMMLWAKLRGIRVVLFAESWYPGSKDAQKGKLVSNLAHTFLVSGQRAKTHFEQNLGIAPQRIDIGYSAVDNSHFEGHSQPEAKTLLCVARFAPEKNLKVLIEAFYASRLPSQEWKLRLVGGGPLKTDLIAWAGRNPSILFSDWLTYAELPALYASASVFVLPSVFEPWGLVTNEAAAARLPLILSEQCGCVPELLEPGVNGWQFSAPDTHRLTEIFNELAQTSPQELRQMGEASHRLVQELGCDRWAQRFAKLAIG